MRLSRIVKQTETPSDSESVPLGRALVWTFIGAVLVLGLVLYFKYERLIAPLVG